MNARTIYRFLASTALLLGLSGASLKAQESASVPASQAAGAPQVEVCFVLDTTGSMGGLIEGAKLKIWSIANQMIAAQPRPRLKVALLAFRDRNDSYVTRLFDLTDDLDAVYANLRTFEAGGGGDEPESVNQALYEAVTKVTWSSSRDVLKIVFVVGDSPPHMDYPDDQKYPAVCELAVKKDLIINTIQCGTNPRTTPIWREIASRAEGRFVAIGQTGDVQIVRTPVDDELATLNTAIGATLLPYGHAAQRDALMAKQAASEDADASAAADRLAYNAATGRVVQGAGDLIDDLRTDKVTLAGLTPEELPTEMRTMTSEQQQEYLQQQAARRRELQARAAELLKQRREFIDAEMKKLLEAGKGNSFDRQVAEIIREQGRRRGIQYGDGTAAQPQPPRPDETDSQPQP